MGVKTMESQKVYGVTYRENSRLGSCSIKTSSYVRMNQMTKGFE